MELTGWNHGKRKFSKLPHFCSANSLFFIQYFIARPVISESGSGQWPGDLLAILTFEGFGEL
jgi:hypothetical protein